MHAAPKYDLCTAYARLIAIQSRFGAMPASKRFLQYPEQPPETARFARARVGGPFPIQRTHIDGPRRGVQRKADQARKGRSRMGFGKRSQQLRSLAPGIAAFASLNLDMLADQLKPHFPRIPRYSLTLRL